MRGLASLALAEERLFNDTGPGPWFVGSPTSVDQWTAYTLSAVWACQTLIADAVATLPVDTFRKKGGMREETAPPSWVETPNPENNRIDYETQRVLSLLGWGNAYTYLLRQGGSADPMAPVIERWLLSPQHVNVQRVTAGVETSQLIYTVRGQRVELGNIQHVRGYVRPGEFLGMSVIDQARRGLGMTADAELAGANLYKQGMSQSGVVEVPQLPAEVSESVVERISDNVMKHNSGARNAGKPLILTGGSKWKPSMMTLSDAEYLQTRRFQTEEICRWFRVPPHKVQFIEAHASQGGGMGIEQMDTEFSQDTLKSWVNRLEIADSALIPRGQYVKYNLNSYVRADMTTRYDAYLKAREAGFMNADQAAALEDMPPLPDGKGQIYLQSIQFAEAGTQPTGPAIPIPAPEPAPQGA